MKILHTSDWHIGRTLYGKKRYDEFEKLFIWLAETIDQEQVDILLVAGDIFDISTPSNHAQELYYRFLCRVATSSCRHVVIIAGNHDSPSFLNAPKALLKTLDIHVVGVVTENAADEVLLLSGENGCPELIVCAVPYLRDRDIRTAEAGESIEDKEQKMLEGIRHHYAKVAKLAEKKRQDLAVQIPIIAMGHLFTAGGKTIDGDGVRSLYVGSLAHVTAGIFPACLDYMALGHLHVPQKVGGSEMMRYSGSPLPMGFGEATQQKSVCLVEFTSSKTSVTAIKIPVFRRLERIKGSWENLLARIRELVTSNAHAWLEIVYEGDTVISDLSERLNALVVGSEIKILRVQNNRSISSVLKQIYDGETLDDLSEYEVFERCLAVNEVSEEQRPELLRTYQETITSLHEDDTQAE